MSRTRFVGLLIVAIGIIVISPIGRALSEEDDSSPAPAQPSTPTPAPSDVSAPSGLSEGPVLTSQQTSDVRELVAKEPEAQRFLEGKAYEITQVGRWITEGAEPRLIGASALVRLGAPASYEVQPWPVAEYDERLDPPYREDVLKLSADQVEELIINVDIEKDRVVSVEPSGSHVEVAPGPNEDAEYGPSSEAPGY